MIGFFKTLSKFFGFDIFNQTYTLKDEEIELWKSIEEKAKCGYQEFWEECEKNPDYMSWPWVSPGLTKEESEFIEKLHYIFFGNDYIVDPISSAQADYVWYEDIKDRIIYDK